MANSEIEQRLREIHQGYVNLKYADDGDEYALQTRCQMLLIKAFGNQGNAHLNHYQALLNPQGFVGLRGSDFHHRDWQKRRKMVMAVLSSAIEDLSITASSGSPSRKGNAVFVIHGRDSGPKETVARLLDRLGLKAVVLHEQPNQGKTLMEKLEANSDVAYAIAILTPEDTVIESPETRPQRSRPKRPESRRRARQNVIFEMGFFHGALGRDKVAILYQSHESFEFPSDYQGMAYIPMDENGGWQASLAKELIRAGLPVKKDDFLA